MKVYLDNILVQEPNDSLLNPVITQQIIDETGDRAFSFTSDLEFTKGDYDYLYDRLVTDPNALENKVILKFVDDCCAQDLEYEFYITNLSVEWCEGKCEIRCSATEKSDSVDQFTCFKNTMIWDNFNNFKDKNHPRMAYCNELRPNWLHDVLLILIMATWTAFLTIGPILIVVAAIIVVINAVIQVINEIINFINSAIGSSIGNINEIDLDNDDSTNAFEEFNNWINNLLSKSFGCGRKHPSPLVRDYITNVCQKCGVGFQSSIYNDSNSDYWNTVFVNAPTHKGTEEADIDTYWIEENQPILSGLQFLDQLAPVTNSKFKIKGNTLFFERRDFFIPSTPWLDLTSYPKDKIKSICWTWSQKNRPSYGSFYYQKDGINWVGSEAVDRWGDIVDWNNSPYSPLQKGEHKPLFQFSACRFRDDGIDRDVLTTYENLPTIGTYLKKYKNAMIMNSHNCFLPMLIIWDGQSTENAMADKFINKNGLGVVGLNQAYNYPFWFRANYPGNLYDRFHAIDNPRSSGYQGFDFTAEVEYDCELLSLIDIDGVVRTSRGDSKESLIVTIDRQKGVLIIKGTV